MSAELKKYRFDYKPGRTPEQLEQERLDENLKRTPTERFRILMQLIKTSRQMRFAALNPKSQ